MKRIIGLLLVFVIIISSVPVSAAETSEEYYAIPVEYSDNRGHEEYIDIMIKNNNVYVNAKMLAERMGYTYREGDEKIVFINSDPSNGLPVCLTIFSINSTKVEHRMLNSLFVSYEAPFATVKNDKGSWVPFEYSLLLINSGMMITDSAVLIDIPTKTIIDYYLDVMVNRQKYQFSWEDDFGYSAKDVNVLWGCSYYVNRLNGLLEFDGASWVSLFQQFAGSYESYDKKYGEDFATLLCTESDKELQETVDKVELMVDALDEDGQLGKALSGISVMQNSHISDLYEDCEVALKNFKNGNSPLVTYNRSYQALEKALDKQTWFTHTGENILEVQKGLSSTAGGAFKFLDVSSKLLKAGGYAQEFQNQDAFTVEALAVYLKKETDDADCLKIMKETMLDYSNSLSSNLGNHMFNQFKNHIDEWIETGLDISSQLENQANIALFAWNLASNTIPFISNGLSSADSFELALYSNAFQNNAFLNYQDKRDSVFADDNNITAGNLYELTQYCYVCLKSCYVTREVAIASLANKRDSVKEQLQPLIEEQNSINKEIAEILVALKEANTTNEGGVYGFLPSDNQEYLKIYDDSHMISWVRTIGKGSIDYADSFKPSYDNTTEYDLYNEIINNLKDKYGEIGLSKTNDNGEVTELYGVCMLRLLDFNEDGVMELFALCKADNEEVYTGYVYTIRNNKVIQLFADRNITAVDLSWETLHFIHSAKHGYVIEGMKGNDLGYDAVLYGFKGQEFGIINTTSRWAEQIDGEWVFTYKINGDLVDTVHGTGGSQIYKDSFDSWMGASAREDAIDIRAYNGGVRTEQSKYYTEETLEWLETPKVLYALSALIKEYKGIGHIYYPYLEGDEIHADIKTIGFENTSRLMSIDYNLNTGIVTEHDSGGMCEEYEYELSSGRPK